MSEPQTATTIAEIERIILASGLWAGIDQVEFSADGVTWSTVFAATTEQPHPAFARATVRRAGAVVPTTVSLAWVESVPADDEWRHVWERAPMALFGSAAIRTAYRRAFRDIVDVVTNPAEGDAPTTDAPTGARDWAAEIDAAADEDALGAVVKALQHARLSTPALDRQWRARRDVLREAATLPPPLDGLESEPPAAVVAGEANRAQVHHADAPLSPATQFLMNAGFRVQAAQPAPPKPSDLAARPQSTRKASRGGGKR